MMLVYESYITNVVNYLLESFKTMSISRGGKSKEMLIYDNQVQNDFLKRIYQSSFY